MLAWLKEYQGKILFVMFVGMMSTAVGTVITAADNKHTGEDNAAAIKTLKEKTIPAVEAKATKLEERVRKTELSSAKYESDLDWIRQNLTALVKAQQTKGGK